VLAVVVVVVLEAVEIMMEVVVLALFEVVKTSRRRKSPLTRAPVKAFAERCVLEMKAEVLGGGVWRGGGVWPRSALRTRRRRCDDEGSSFQRQPVAFTPDTLVFHPKEEDKLLAYCKEGREVMFRNLSNLWSVSGVDLDPDLVHMEMQDSSGAQSTGAMRILGALALIGLRAPMCVTTGNRTKHYVSHRRNEFVQMRFPKYALPKPEWRTGATLDTITVIDTWVETGDPGPGKGFEMRNLAEGSCGDIGGSVVA
ncbi:hypothetical protein CRUP_036152, partial [Coryphaenoides rupestris]